MKKIILYVILVVITFVALFLIADMKMSKNTHKGQAQTVETIKRTEHKNNTGAALQDSKPDQKELTNTEVQTLGSLEARATCMEKYTSDPKWIEIYKRFEGLGLSGDELAGTDSYQQLPLDSLKAHADTGDKKAMYLYGVETMWKSAFGFYMNGNYRGPLGFTEERKKQIQQHKVNLEEYQEGADYVYQAAVQGKLTGLMEIASQQSALINAMQQDGFSEEALLNEAVTAYSYLLLMREVYQYDEMLYEILGDDKSLDSNLTRIFKDNKEITIESMRKIRSDVIARSEKKFQILKASWENDRNYHGLEPYPNLFTAEEEEYYQKAELDCQ